MGSAPDFWWKPRMSLASLLLAPAGWIYGLVAVQRMLAKPDYHSRLPVICIGNFVAGGTGKTPFAITLASLLRSEGLTPGFLLRGYGGNLKQPTIVEPDIHGSAEVGDEALLLSAHGPVIVSSDRPAGARLAETLQIDVLLMDDGFQNPSLAKDLSIVLVDRAVGFGNGSCIPAGPMRAPATRQIIKADCIVLVGEGDRAEDAIHLAGRKGLPILNARLRPIPNEDLVDRPLFAFAGIGRPQKFFSTLEAMGLEVARSKAFADHHAFTEKDAQALLTQAEAEGLQLVTTAKDMARLKTSSGELFHWLAARSQVLDVAMAVDEEERLKALVQESRRNRQFHRKA